MPKHSLLLGRFLERPHRFGAYVEVAGRVRYVHVPASARMRELLVPGNDVLVADIKGEKTDGRLVFARQQEGWVSTDAQLPGRVVKALLKGRCLPPFAMYNQVQPEYSYGDSRLDFRLDADGGELPPCLIEVKSVTLVTAGTARFPDAPTARGTRHVWELIHAREQGWRAAVLFIIQRPDGRRLVPNDVQDPAFGKVLRAAGAAGVEIHAYRARVEPPEIKVIVDQPVPVIL